MKSLTRGHIKAGLDSVRSTKWRNFWTMLGIIIGVASVISVVGIGDGIKAQVNFQLHHTNSHVIVIRPSALNGTSNGILGLISGLNISGTLGTQDSSVVAKVPGVEAAAPLSAITAKVVGDQSTYHSGLVIGSTAPLLSLLNQSVQYGYFIGANNFNGNTVVLGSQAANDLFSEQIPLGQTLTIDGQPFTVGGILNAFPSNLLSQNSDYNSAVFISYNLEEKLTNNTAATFEILAKPNNMKDSKQVASAISAALTKAHGGQTDFTVTSSDQNLTTNDSIVSLLTKLVTGIAAISLVVGGIGIMNVMLVSVTERMHEIGIRKAVGATNRQILSQFMVESTFLSLTGGVIGVIIALLLDLTLHLVTNLNPIISWQTVALATIVSVLLGIVFGSVPAFKAARKDPISALRAE